VGFLGLGVISRAVASLGGGVITAASRAVAPLGVRAINERAATV
jgi:hypothetical protein